MDRITHRDIWNALPAVTLMTLGITAAACILTGLALLYFGFDDAKAHLAIAFIVPVILTPLAAFPLVIVSQRLHRMRTEPESQVLVDGLTEPVVPGSGLCRPAGRRS